MYIDKPSSSINPTQVHFWKKNFQITAFYIATDLLLVLFLAVKIEVPHQEVSELNCKRYHAHQSWNLGCQNISLPYSLSLEWYSLLAKTAWKVHKQDQELFCEGISVWQNQLQWFLIVTIHVNGGPGSALYVSNSRFSHVAEIHLLLGSKSPIYYGSQPLKLITTN